MLDWDLYQIWSLQLSSVNLGSSVLRSHSKTAVLNKRILHDRTTDEQALQSG